MSMSKLEYLKKYMSPDTQKDNKKMKKKKLKPVLKGKGGIKIIDEEIDLKRIAAEFQNEEDLLDTQEDAPFVAGVIDERSEELRTKQDFVDNKKWKQLGANQDFSVRESADASESSVSTISSKKLVAEKCKPSNKKTNARQGSRRHDSDSDTSPPRKHQRSNSDASPPRRRHDSDSDASPPRKHQKSDSDASPPRRRHDSDASPPRRRCDSDASPPRRRKESDSDASPPRKHQKSDSDASPPRRKPNLSPIRIKPDPDGPSKRTTTLDGKKAGLQTGFALHQEMKELQKKQKEAFRKMDESLTGQNAITAVRASKKRQMEAKIEEEKVKQEKLAKLEAVYSKWNKGLKQGQDQSEKLVQDLYEMTKPMARFAADEDLDEHLRVQMHDGDPMAQYLSKKKVQKSGKPARPVYRGPADNPNRFSILPGYRWDGVDRSNGFEKKYYEMQNKGVAIQEDAYKWSVSDM